MIVLQREYIMHIKLLKNTQSRTGYNDKHYFLCIRLYKRLFSPFNYDIDERLLDNRLRKYPSINQKNKKRPTIQE